MKLTEMQKDDLRQSLENAIGLWERSGDESAKMSLEAVPKSPSGQIHIVVSFPRIHVSRSRDATLADCRAMEIPPDQGRGD